MLRRSLLSGILIKSLIASGCLGRRDDERYNAPDGMDISTTHIQSDILVDESHRNWGSISTGDEYCTSIEDEGSANSLLDTEIDEVISFIEPTNFNESYIVLVQNVMQSDLELELGSVKKEGNKLKLSVDIEAPRNSGPDDQAIHSLLIRVTDTEPDPPDSLNVSVEGYI